MKTAPSTNAIRRIRSSFAVAGMKAPSITAVTSTIVMIEDGQSRWFARAARIPALTPPAASDAQERSMAYSEWATSHRAMTERDLPRPARRIARECGWSAAGW